MTVSIVSLNYIVVKQGGNVYFVSNMSLIMSLNLRQFNDIFDDITSINNIYINKTDQCRTTLQQNLPTGGAGTEQFCHRSEGVLVLCYIIVSIS